MSWELFSMEMMKSETLCLCACHIKGSGGIDSWQHVKSQVEEDDEEDGFKKLSS